MDWLPLLAQGDAIPPGWLSVIVQGGSFALLTYIAVYLGPKLLKDARDERENRDAKFEGVVKELQQQFEARNDKLVRAIGVQTDKLVTEMERGTDAITQILANTCNYEPPHTRVPRKPKEG